VLTNTPRNAVRPKRQAILRFAPSGLPWVKSRRASWSGAGGNHVPQSDQARAQTNPERANPAEPNRGRAQYGLPATFDAPIFSERIPVMPVNTVPLEGPPGLLSALEPGPDPRRRQGIRLRPTGVLAVAVYAGYRRLNADSNEPRVTGLSATTRVWTHQRQWRENTPGLFRPQGRATPEPPDRPQTPKSAGGSSHNQRNRGAAVASGAPRPAQTGADRRSDAYPTRLCAPSHRTETRRRCRHHQGQPTGLHRHLCASGGRFLMSSRVSHRTRDSRSPWPPASARACLWRPAFTIGILHMRWISSELKDDLAINPPKSRNVGWGSLAGGSHTRCKTLTGRLGSPAPLVIVEERPTVSTENPYHGAVSERG
jgi:hypothetical protein